MIECPVCQWRYDPEEWDAWHEVPAHGFPPCAGGGTKLVVATPCLAKLQVYVKEIHDGIAVVFVQSENNISHYPFTVPVEHLSEFRMVAAMSNQCKRRCHDCGNIAMHKDNIVPHVLCSVCGSQDTRLIDTKQDTKR